MKLALFSIALNGISLIWNTSCSFGTAIIFCNGLIGLGYLLFFKWSFQPLLVEDAGMSYNISRRNSHTLDWVLHTVQVTEMMIFSIFHMNFFKFFFKTKTSDKIRFIKEDSVPSNRLGVSARSDKVKAGERRCILNEVNFLF